MPSHWYLLPLAMTFTMAPPMTFLVPVVTLLFAVFSHPRIVNGNVGQSHHAIFSVAVALVMVVVKAVLWLCRLT